MRRTSESTIVMIPLTADSGLDPVLIVEAALFSAGKPLLVEEIAENAGLDRRKVPGYLKDLQQRYHDLNGALEVGRAGDKWAMQVRTRYAEKTTKLAPMEIPLKLLKTDGKTVDVKAPSDQLFLDTGFDVASGRQTDFVFDIQVHTEGNGSYIFQPNATGSGPGRR